jgi:hypothetical protein
LIACDRVFKGDLGRLEHRSASYRSVSPAGRARAREPRTVHSKSEIGVPRRSDRSKP